MGKCSRHVMSEMSRFVSPGWETKRRSLGTEALLCRVEAPEMTPTKRQPGAMTPGSMPRSGRYFVVVFEKQQVCRVCVCVCVCV
jgi:hypothetical protein